jgi:membrane-bound metal-dependent hydrolase YbcI (DUF457 family)
LLIKKQEDKMMYKTHVVFAIFLYFLLATIFHFQKAFYVALAIAIGALLPDIDSSSSWINKKVKVTKVAAVTSKHRGFWHSIFGIACLSILLAAFFLITKISLVFVAYIALGALSHLLADALTVEGIRPLWKLSSFSLRWRIRTKSIAEYVLFFALLILTIYLYSPLFNLVMNVIKAIK